MTRREKIVFALLLCTSSWAAAQVIIPNLPPATLPLSGNENVPLWQGTKTVQAPASALGSGAAATVVPTVSALGQSNFSGSNAVSLLGYNSPGDGGGGTLTQVPASNCSSLTNGILTFQDGALPTPTCFKRNDQPGIDPQWGGAKCDGQTETGDGTISAGTDIFNENMIPLDQSYVGKQVAFIYGGSTPPWVTSIKAINSPSQAVTADLAPTGFPNTFGSIDATFGDDSNPGTGIGIGDTWVDPVGGATGTFTEVIYACNGSGTTLCDVSNISNEGTGYAVGDPLVGSCSSCGANQIFQAQIHVATISGGGSTGPATSFVIDAPGLWVGANPPGLTWTTTGNGSGFSTNNLANNGSWGSAGVVQTAGGTYSAVPDNPVSVTDTVSGSQNSSLDLHFHGAPEYAIFTNDNTPFQNIINLVENVPTNNDNQTRTLWLPQSKMCFATGLTLSRTESWKGGGPNQSRIVQIPGSTGTSVNGSPNAFITIAPVLPEHVSQLMEADQLSIQDLSILSLTTSSSVTVGSTPTTYNNDGVLITSALPKDEHDAALLMRNVFVMNFPRHLLESSTKYLGEFRFEYDKFINSNNVITPFSGTSTSGSSSISGVSSGSLAAINADLAQMGALSVPLQIGGQGVPLGTTVNGTIGGIGNGQVLISNPIAASVTTQFYVYGGGNCAQFAYNANPTHINALEVAYCNYGANFFHASQYDMHQIVSYENNIAFAYSGYTDTRTKLACPNCQFAKSNAENVQLDQINGAIYAPNALVFGGNTISAPSTSPASANFVIGADAGGSGNNYFTSLYLPAPVLLGPGNPLGGSANTFYFAPSSSGGYCNCNVSMTDLTTQEINNGIPIVYPASQAFRVHVDGVNLPSQAGIACNPFGTQNGATPTYSSINIVSGAAPGSSCGLPPADGSGHLVLVNVQGSYPINEYAQVGDSITSASGPVPYRQMAVGAALGFRSYAVHQWTTTGP